ncbi:MAG: D-alanyl-D-alanine carboxypeptidase [Oscillospiraceae bacterium]|nr:D-alanyl-D-alanine carboxypeptidase [Oscillospiraceae bacterium]
MKKFKKNFFCLFEFIILSLFIFSYKNILASEPIEILSKSAILMDQKTGNILYEYNSDQQEAPASLTKIMSLILIFENIENGNLSETQMLRCSKYANSINGSQIWLDEGEEMSVEDLLKAVIISSANDATVVFAEEIAGSEQSFVDLMNEKAKKLGLKYTCFKNCTGLDEDGHLTTAREVAIVARELLKHEKIFKYTKIWMDQLRDGKTELVNTNRLIRFYPGATGLKTGTSDNAGCCLAASATREGLSLISVVMGAQNSDDRFQMSKQLLNFGFDNFVSVKLENIQEEIPNLKINSGNEEYVGLKINPPDSLLIEKTKLNKINQKINLPKKLDAPVLENQIVGRVLVSIDGEKILEYPIVASKEIKKINFFGALKKILLNIIDF